MRSSVLFFGLSALTGVLAADKVVSMFISDNDEDTVDLIGKVIGTESDRTSYSLTCADTATSCDIGGITVVQGPSTYSAIATVGNPYTVACALGSAVATCTLNINGTESIDSWTENRTSYPVTITAGGSAPGSSAPVSTTASATSTGTKSGASSTTTASAADAEVSGADDTTDNAAMARITGMPWAAGAVAVGMAAVAMV
ncbi:hypothetical protein BJX99DRAFT_219697 [Aspergillus californicus]